MRNIAAAAAVVTAAAVTLAAQDSTPIFRAGTTLVEFTIVATDLTQHDITIVQNGKPQPVAFFRFEGSAFGPGAAEAKHEPIAPGIFTNRSEYFPGPARNVTAARPARRIRRSCRTEFCWPKEKASTPHARICSSSVRLQGLTI